MITLKLTEAEMQALAGLMDAGLRATGIRAARDAAVLLQKLESAVEAAKAAQQSDNVVKMDAAE